MSKLERGNIKSVIEGFKKVLDDHGLFGYEDKLFLTLPPKCVIPRCELTMIFAEKKETSEETQENND